MGRPDSKASKSMHHDGIMCIKKATYGIIRAFKMYMKVVNCGNINFTHSNYSQSLIL